MANIEDKVDALLSAVVTLASIVQESDCNFNLTKFLQDHGITIDAYGPKWEEWRYGT